MKINAEPLLDPREPGIVHVRKFLTTTALLGVRSELARIPDNLWHDEHGQLPPNARGVAVTQNFDAFALKLSRHEQHNWVTAYNYPHMMGVVDDIRHAVADIARSVWTLRDWMPGEVRVQRYDTPDVGISYHRDSRRFWGVIALAAIEGEAELRVNHGGGEVAFSTIPGDLILMRAPGLINTDAETRPEHAVTVQTAPRTSLTVRADTRPDEPVPGSTFANWSPA